MITQTQTRPNSLNVKGLEDIIYLLRESEENYQKNGGMSVQESYEKNQKRLSYIFNS